MVAETPNPPSKRTSKGRDHTIPAISLLSRAKARNMYLTQGLDWKTISAAVGVPPNRLMQLANREGWTAKKRELIARLNARTDARSAAQLDEVSEAIASESEEIALSGLQRARDSLGSGSEFAARDFQSYTGGVRNLVQVARAIREPMGAQIGANGAAGLSVFILRVGDAGASTPKGVEQAKQVTEISASLTQSQLPAAQAEPQRVTPVETEKQAQ